MSDLGVDHLLQDLLELEEVVEPSGKERQRLEAQELLYQPEPEAPARVECGGFTLTTLPESKCKILKC